MPKHDATLIDEMVLNQIYMVRGQKVMLASDLAQLYGIETFRLNEQVKRNLTRFPLDFMFQLTAEEWMALTSQIAMSKIKRGGSRTRPYVFTEHGVLMLSSVLNNDRAIQVNIQIMRIFVKMRQMLTDYATVRLEIAEIKEAFHTMTEKQQGHDKNIDLIFTYIDRLQEKIEEPKAVERKRLGYEIKGTNHAS